ncbi:hypothetical protein RHGRI_009631 [Rhododendron griersonianum]|uniref:Uncharacterized protein n=1 Tax=Rhododendron griersonianum TaxID=479676 RepID=A0AAV6KFG8_9ERIC|nr:hypothetical protein RHGRI_009631 [Rhododendron griersonianum]
MASNKVAAVLLIAMVIMFASSEVAPADLCMEQCIEEMLSSGAAADRANAEEICYRTVCSLQGHIKH